MNEKWALLATEMSCIFNEHFKKTFSWKGQKPHKGNFAILEICWPLKLGVEAWVGAWFLFVCLQGFFQWVVDVLVFRVLAWNGRTHFNDGTVGGWLGLWGKAAPPCAPGPECESHGYENEYHQDNYNHDNNCCWSGTLSYIFLFFTRFFICSPVWGARLWILDNCTSKMIKFGVKSGF